MAYEIGFVDGLFRSPMSKHLFADGEQYGGLLALNEMMLKGKVTFESKIMSKQTTASKET